MLVTVLMTIVSRYECVYVLMDSACVGVLMCECVQVLMPSACVGVFLYSSSLDTQEKKRSMQMCGWSC
jgi:hypothetical protein